LNTDKTLKEKFIEKKGYPIWYHKELKETTVDWVIWNLLKESFVVEIDGSKHEITFGKNRKGEINQCIRYDDIKHSNLCSYQVVEKGFKEGKWFTISNINTSDEFKADHEKRKEEYHREETKQWYIKILTNFIEDKKDLSEERRSGYLEEINNSSYEELEKLVTALFKNAK
jgi:hypothetical protein